MKRFLILAGLLGLTSTAFADGGALPDLPQNFAPADTLGARAPVEGAGIKVGEGTVIHPTVGVETGGTSNVFFEDSGTNAAGLLRAIVELQTGTLPKQRTTIDNQDATDPSQQSEDQGSLQYDLWTFLSWDQYLSSSDAVTSQSGLGAGLLLRAIARPGKPVSLGFVENFNRMLRATNFESRSQTTRDINQVNIRLLVAPRGRTLSGYAYYQNLIDHFEDDNQQFADRLQHTIGVRVNWQWLPLTRLYVDVSEGIFGGLGSESTKSDAFPLTAVAGLQTVLTLNTTLNARVGYTRGFYSSGPDYSSVTGGLQLGYRYSPLGRITAMYSYDHQDSVNANFFRDHAIALMLEHLMTPFVVIAKPELHFRRYEGITDVMGTSTNRDDTIVAITLGARYMFRDWVALTADYELASVQTDFRYVAGNIMDDPSYTRQQVLIGLRAAY